MASRGQIQIDVVADTSKFSKQLEQQLKAALKGLKIQPVRVDGDTDAFTKKVRKAQADAESSFKGMFDRLKKQSSTAGKGIGTALGLSIAATLSSLTGPIVSGTVAILSSIGPAVLATVPAAVGVLGTLQVALFGIGDALKEVGSDQEKFNDSIKNLSPNAKKFAQSLRSILPDLTSLKNAVQDRFFAGFDKDLEAVSKNLAGPLEAGMVGVAGQLNGIVHQFFEFAASAKGAQVVNTIFEVTSKLLAQVSDAFGPLLNRVGDWIIKAGNSGVNSAFIEAKNVLKDLAATAGNVGSSIKLIFGGLDADGPKVAEALKNATQAVKDFLASAQGQELINGLSAVMGQIREVAGKLFDAVKSLSPEIIGLASGAFATATTAAKVLLDGLTALGDETGDDKQLFFDFGVVIAGVVIAVKAYQAAVVLGTAAQIAWSAATSAASTATTIFTAVTNTARVAVLLSTTGFYAAGAAVTTAATALWGQVSALAAVAAGWLRTAVQAALNTVRLVAYTVATNAVKVATVAWTAVQWLLNAAMTANPIGIVIALIVALVAAIVIAYKKSDTFRAIVDAAFKAVGDAAIWLWENGIKPLWEGIVAAFNFIVAAAKAWWNDSVAIFNAVVGVISGFVSTVIEFFSNLASGAAEKFSALVSFVSSIPGKILSALGNVGRLLYDAGSNIVAGLRDGIAGAWHWVTDKVNSLIGLIPKAIRDLLGIGSPSKVTMQLGAYTGQGFAEGVESQIPAVVQASRRMAGAVGAAPRSGGTFSGDVRGGDGAGVAGTPGPGVRMWPTQPDRKAGMGTLVIESGGSKMDELLVQVLSKAVRVRGGNVQKVLGKTQAGVS